MTVKKIFLFPIFLLFFSCEKKTIPDPTIQSYPKIVEKLGILSNNPLDTFKVTYEYDSYGRIKEYVSYNPNGSKFTSTFSYFSDSIITVTKSENPQISNSTSYRFGTYHLSNDGNVIKLVVTQSTPTNISSTVFTYIWNGLVVDSVETDYYNPSGILFSTTKTPFVEKPISSVYSSDTIPSYIKKTPFIIPFCDDHLNIFGESFNQYNFYLPNELSYSNPDFSSNFKYSYKWSGNKISEILIDKSGVANGQTTQGWTKIILVYE